MNGYRLRSARSWRHWSGAWDNSPVARPLAIVAAALLCVAVLLLALPASATEFFAADFESGDLSEWGYVQAIPDRAAAVDEPAAEGDYAGRFEVEEGDEEPDTGSQRAEVRSGLEFEEGDVRYFRVLSRVESWDYDHWGIVWQIHDQTGDSPPLSLQLRDDDSGPMLWLGHGDGEPEHWETPLPEEDEWFEVVVRAEFGEEGSSASGWTGRSRRCSTARTASTESTRSARAPATTSWASTARRMRWTRPSSTTTITASPTSCTPTRRIEPPRAFRLVPKNTY